MNRILRTLGVVLAMSPAATLAQVPTTLPPGVFAGERDIALATAGTYKGLTAGVNWYPYNNVRFMANLTKAKQKVDAIVKKTGETIKQLFYAERAILDWQAHGFMQEKGEEKD